MSHGWNPNWKRFARGHGARFCVMALAVGLGTGLFWNVWYSVFPRLVDRLTPPRVPTRIAQGSAHAAPTLPVVAPTPARKPSIETVEFFRDERGKIQLCQACGPSCGPGYGPGSGVDVPYTGVACDSRAGNGEARWSNRQALPWEIFAQGEYIGPARTPDVNVYRLRPGDMLQLIYRLTRERIDEPYELNVGDEIKVESLTDATLDRTLVIQPDGTVTLRLLNQVPAAGRTVEEIRKDLEERYKKYYKVPSITVTPVKVDTRLEDLRASIRVNFGTLAQGTQVTMTPEGTIQLPGIGSVFLQGLSLQEAKHEIDERYRMLVHGIEITPSLMARAPRHIYVLGEVRNPGQFTLTGPTTVMQSIAFANGWNVGGNLRQIVVFRRNDDWRLMATKIDLAGALYGKRPTPADEIWLRDQDIVLIPKNPVRRADDWIGLLFTRGLYGVMPVTTTGNGVL